MEALPLKLASVQVVDETIVPVFGNHENAWPLGRADGRRCAPPIARCICALTYTASNTAANSRAAAAVQTTPSDLELRRPNAMPPATRSGTRQPIRLRGSTKSSPGPQARTELRRPQPLRWPPPPLPAFPQAGRAEAPVPLGDDQDQAGEGRRPLNVVDGGATRHPARLLAGHEAHCRFPGPGSKRQVGEQVPPAASLLGQRQRQQRQTNRGGAGDRQDRATAVRDRGDEPEALRGDRERREVMRAEGQGGSSYPQRQVARRGIPKRAGEEVQPPCGKEDEQGVGARFLRIPDQDGLRVTNSAAITPARREANSRAAR